MLAILLIRDCISILEQDEALFIKVSGSTHGERFKNYTVLQQILAICASYSLLLM